MKKSYKKPEVVRASIWVKPNMKHNAKCSGGTSHKVPAKEDFA